MEVTPRMRRSAIVFLAGFISFAVFQPVFGVLPALGVGIVVAAAALAIDARVTSRRSSRRGA